MKSRFWLVLTAAPLLAACGGGGSQIASTPTPTPVPTPTPPPPPTPTTPPPIPAGLIGLQGDKPFATVGVWTDGWGTLSTGKDAVRIAYSAADNRYVVTLPGYQEGYLITKGGNGSFDANGWIDLISTTNDVTQGSGPATQPVMVILDWPASSDFKYTSFGQWLGPLPMGENQGVFAYGSLTAAGDMPLTGSASYAGEIRGLTDGMPPGGNGGVYPLSVWGSVLLSFNFGAGTLSGQMKPELAPEWDAVSLGTYTFRDTVYSAGSTSFTGAFVAPGTTGSSSFSGNFTGPQGAELMAIWNAPYIYPGTTHEGRMSGVWIAKKN